MISGIVLLTAALFWASPPPAAADNGAATQLIAQLARPAPARTPYAEVRLAHLLRKPLVLRGELEYGGAQKLGKRVDTPYRENLTIADGEVTVQRDGRPERKFSLQRAPELQALLSGFGALLGGNAAALQEHFTLDLANDAAHWTLTITPRDAQLGKQLRNMVVDGAGNEPRCFTLNETNGDVSVMLIGALAAATLAEPATTAALAALCRNTP